MAKKMIFRLGIVILLAILLFVVPEHVLAVFSLSVTPYEGGYDLMFGKLDPEIGRMNKEVKVSISTDIAKRYLLTQTFIEPLSTLEGSRIPTNNFLVYAIRGSNQYGTINVEQEVPVILGRQIIYTSNQSGSADSFTLVYSLVYSPDIEPGLYKGKMSFNLEPVDSSQSPVNVVLNISLEIEIKSLIEIKTGVGTKDILLKPGQQDLGFSDVVVEIKGGFGRQFRILQLPGEPLLSNEGKVLDWPLVKYVGTGATKGMVVNEPTALLPQQQIIYTSSPRGEADSFVINYRLGDLSGQEAGIFRSKIKYILEGIGFAETRIIDSLGLQIENPRIFDLVITPELGGTIRFSNVKPLQPAKTQEVMLEIKSNIGKQYQVTQNMSTLLTTKEGSSIAKEFFTLRQESLETKGTLKYPQKIEINEGQMVLFISDKKGSTDKFKVIYELNVPSDIHSGDYFTNFNYSISEI